MPKKKSLEKSIALKGADARGTSAATARSAAKPPRSAEADKVKAPRAASTKTPAPVVDYPLEGEIVTSPVYTFRITALEPVSVDVSLDGNEWLPARESVGHWWVDWSGYQSGAHTLVVRMADQKGKTVKSKPRSFTVLI